MEHYPIDIWCLRVEASDTDVSRLDEILSLDERDRGRSFRFQHLRRAYTITRGTLRLLLGRYLGVAPQDIFFQYTSTGKPKLVVDCGMHFNVSHSGQFALLAFTRDCEIGVDIEKVRPVPEMMSIAERFFSADEAAELAATPDEERQRAFFRCWTRKEACIKATGEGLSALLSLRGHAEATSEWMLHDIQLPSDYVGAVAYRGQARPINLVATTPGCVFRGQADWDFGLMPIKKSVGPE